MAKKNTLEQFVDHQKTAAEEAGKALLSLIPSGLRSHGWKAIEETARGFGVLIDGAAKEVGKVLNSVDDSPKTTPPTQSSTKVRVDLDEQNKEY